MRSCPTMIVNSILSEGMPLSYMPGMAGIVGYYLNGSNRFLAIESWQDSKRTLSIYQLHLTFTKGCRLFNQDIDLSVEERRNSSSFFSCDNPDSIKVEIHRNSGESSFITLQELKKGFLRPIEYVTVEKIAQLKRSLNKNIQDSEIVGPDYLKTVCETEDVFRSQPKSSSCCHIL